MFFHRTLPPAAAPIPLSSLLSGLFSARRGQTEVERFSHELKAYFQVKHCFLISSGKAALTLILQALKEQCPARDEVLIPAFTCYSVPSAIIRAGLRVRLADVDPASLDYDFAHLEKVLWQSERLLAVLSPDLFGLPADCDRLNSLLALRNQQPVALIEDAAQAMGGTEHGRLLGTRGHVGFFSLGRGKALSTVQGGIILSNDSKLAERLQVRLSRLPGPGPAQTLKMVAQALALAGLTHPRLFWLPKALPWLRLGETLFEPDFPMRSFSPFQVGLARGWPERLRTLQQARQARVQGWLQALDRFSWLQPLAGLDQNKPYPLLRLPLLVRSHSLRQAVLQASEHQGLGLMPSYPDSIDGIKGLEIVNSKETFPGAKACARRLLTFPVHGYVTRPDQQRILHCLERIQAEKGKNLTTATTGIHSAGIGQNVSHCVQITLPLTSPVEKKKLPRQRLRVPG